MLWEDGMDVDWCINFPSMGQIFTLMDIFWIDVDR